MVRGLTSIYWNLLKKRAKFFHVLNRSEENIEIETFEDKFDDWYFRLIDQEHVIELWWFFTQFNELIMKVFAFDVLFSEYTDCVDVCLWKMHVQEKRTKFSNFDMFFCLLFCFSHSLISGYRNSPFPSEFFQKFNRVFPVVIRVLVLVQFVLFAEQEFHILWLFHRFLEYRDSRRPYGMLTVLSWSAFDWHITIHEVLVFGLIWLLTYVLQALPIFDLSLGCIPCTRAYIAAWMTGYLTPSLVCYIARMKLHLFAIVSFVRNERMLVTLFIFVGDFRLLKGKFVVRLQLMKTFLFTFTPTLSFRWVLWLKRYLILQLFWTAWSLFVIVL